MRETNGKITSGQTANLSCKKDMWGDKGKEMNAQMAKSFSHDISTAIQPFFF